MTKPSIPSKSQDRIPLLFIALASVLLTSFVCPYAPWFRFCFETDETVYRVVSLGWIRGKLPYRDLFDHKGPLTYVFYAAGLLLSGGKSWGMWIILCVINAITFTTMYRIFRLKFGTDHSCVSTAVVMFLLTFFKDSLFSSGSKPENIITMFLMISTYYFVKATIRYQDMLIEERKKNSVFTGLEMLLIGLCCGCIFMIKFNICIFYLCFIGSYFLWLVIKCRWREFFSRTGIFLAPVAGITGVCFLYYYLRNGLSDLISTYFVFNIRYGGKGKWTPHIFQSLIPIPTQAVTLLLILLSGATLYITIEKRNGSKKQSIVYLILGAFVYLFITSPEIYFYSFIVLLPLYIYGVPLVVELAMLHRSKGITKPKLAVIFIFPVLFSFLINFIAMPSIPSRKNAFEEQMRIYAEAHPKATYLFFMNNTFTSPMFYDLTSEVPSFKYFFIPPRATDEMENEHLRTIARGEPDVIVIQNPKDQDQNIMQKYYGFFEKNGYEYFLEGDGYQYGSNYLIYTKKEPVSN